MVSETTLTFFLIRWFESEKYSRLTEVCGLKNDLKTVRIGWESDVAVYSVRSLGLPKPPSQVTWRLVVVFAPLPATAANPSSAAPTEPASTTTAGMDSLPTELTPPAT